MLLGTLLVMSDSGRNCAAGSPGFVCEGWSQTPWRGVDALLGTGCGRITGRGDGGTAVSISTALSSSTDAAQDDISSSSQWQPRISDPSAISTIAEKSSKG